MKWFSPICNGLNSYGGYFDFFQLGNYRFCCQLVVMKLDQSACPISLASLVNNQFPSCGEVRWSLLMLMYYQNKQNVPAKIDCILRFQSTTSDMCYDWEKKVHFSSRYLSFKFWCQTLALWCCLAMKLRSWQLESTNKDLPMASKCWIRKLRTNETSRHCTFTRHFVFRKDHLLVAKLCNFFTDTAFCTVSLFKKTSGQPVLHT